MIIAYKRLNPFRRTVMKKSLVFFISLALVLLFCVQARADVLKLSHIPADTQWLIHIDLEKFGATQLNTLLMDNGIAPSIKKLRAKFNKKYGFDPVHDITGITIYGMDKEEKTVVQVAGKFDKEHLLGLLNEAESHKELTHGKYVIYTWGRSEAGVFVTDNLVLLGQREDIIRKSLDVIDGKKEDLTTTAMKGYMQEVPSEAFLMAIAKDVSALTQHEDTPVILKKAGMAVLSALEKKENLIMDLKFEAGSAKDAENLVQVIKGLIALADMHRADLDFEFMLPDDISVTTQDDKVHVGVAYPTEALVDLISKGKLPQIHALNRIFPF